MLKILKSIQNITIVVGLISVLFLSASFVVTTAQCASASDCVAAVILYKPNLSTDFKVAQTTAQTQTDDSGYSFSETMKEIQIVSIYTLAFAVAFTIVLELMKLRYLKMFITASKRRASLARR